jgi:hypothetical protein
MEEVARTIAGAIVAIGILAFLGFIFWVMWR